MAFADSDALAAYMIGRLGPRVVSALGLSAADFAESVDEVLEWLGLDEPADATTGDELGAIRQASKCLAFELAADYAASDIDADIGSGRVNASAMPANLAERAKYHCGLARSMSGPEAGSRRRLECDQDAGNSAGRSTL